MNLSKFWSIAVVSNPVRYKSRYSLFHQFKRRFPHAHNLLVVEIAFGDRPFECTQKDNPFHLQLRTFDELWHKENMINLGIQYLSQLAPDWEYVAWIDADLTFSRDDFIEETWHKLQHHMFVQMFSTSIDLGPDHEAILMRNGFVHNWRKGIIERPYGPPGYDYGYIGHPGYAWAARREAIDAVGGLIDFAILGSGDYLMAMAMIGKASQAMRRDYTDDYKSQIHIWQDRALKHIRMDIGYVNGNVMHHWHGKKRDRKYAAREVLLCTHAFQPSLDLKRDAQGLYQLDPDRLEFRDAIRSYMSSRNEDSIDLE